MPIASTISAMTQIAYKLKELREKKGFTRQELASKTGLSYIYLASIESGQRGGNFRADTLLKIARAFDMSVEDFMAYQPTGQHAIKERGPEYKPDKRRARIISRISDLPDDALNAIEKLVDYLAKRGSDEK